MPTTARILEVGSGYSTLWWAQRGNRVLSLEANSEWAARVIGEADARGLSDAINVEVIDEASAYSKVESLSVQCPQFDVVVNDGVEPRGPLSKPLAGCLTDTGLLVLDNSDRERYAQAIEALQQAGWRKLDFFGLGPINTYAWMTTIFFRAPPTVSGRALRPRMITT